MAVVLDSLGVRGAIIVATNFGASVALRMAYRRADLVRAVLSLDGGPIDRPYTAGVSTAMTLGPLLRIFGGRGWARRHIRAALRVMRAMRDSPASEPLHDNLGRITQPVRLLLDAANRRNGVGPDEVAELRAGLRDFSVDSVARSGVNLAEERPDTVAAAVLAVDAILATLPAIAGTRSQQS